VKPIDIISAICVIGLWAGNFVAAKYMLNYWPPFFMSAIRFGVVAVLLLPFAKIPYGAFKKIFYLSLTLGILHFGLIMVGLKGLDASTSTIAVQAGVPFSVLLASIVLKEKLYAHQIVGICISFIGFLVLVGEPQIFSRLGPFLIVVAAAFFWAIANLQSRGLKGVSGFSLNAWFALFTMPELLIMSFATEDGQMEGLLEADLTTYFCLMYTVVMSTIVAYGMWYRLLSKYPVSQVAPFNMLSPFFGALFGVLFYNESMTWLKIIGAIVIVTGVSILVFYKPKSNKVKI
jgi:O-acetylserine/cysteine efflux transporter